MTPAKKRLAEGETEYLLWVPYGEKERAKRIEGYRWDGAQKCWAFRKSQRAYDAIVSEFGDELENQTTQPQVRKPESHPPATVPVSRPAQQPPSRDDQQSVLRIQHLGQRIVELEESLRIQIGLRERAEQGARLARSQAAEYQAKILTLEAKPKSDGLNRQLELANANQVKLRTENTALLERVRAVEQSRQEIEKKAKVEKQYLEKKLIELEEQKTKLQRQAMASEEPASAAALSAKELNRRLIGFAVKAAGNDTAFSALVEKQVVARGLEVKIASELAGILSSKLTGVSPRSDLNDILLAAKKDAVLAHDEYILADLVRRQRNTLAHQSPEKAVVTVRLLLILYSAALLWPKLSGSTSR